MNVAEEELQLQITRKEFEGDVTLVIFPLAKKVGKNPENFGAEIGS
jgi:arginyl-tRNA synthetase